MASNISSTILQSWRERPPFSYSFKVKNFSQLETSTIFSNGKYKSRCFSSGDYKWRMVIYPKENVNESGSGFISMYLEIDSKSLISSPQHEVYADIRFFVFNKKENKYFTIQDVEPKPFNSLRTLSGLSQVLSLDTFKDKKNGYIFDGDHCEFGVEIIVVLPPTKLEIFSFDDNLHHSKFCRTVKHFFESKENHCLSDSFPMGGNNWVLSLYPKGYPTPGSKWLSIYLYLSNYKTMKDDEEINVELTVGSIIQT